MEGATHERAFDLHLRISGVRQDELPGRTMASHHDRGRAYLQFDSLRNGDASHLNAIAARWRKGLRQVRTEIPSNKLVSMNLKTAAGVGMRLTLPDMSGESYQDMFEARECDPARGRVFEGESGAAAPYPLRYDKAPLMITSVAAQTQALGGTISASPGSLGAKIGTHTNSTRRVSPITTAISSRREL